MKTYRAHKWFGGLPAALLGLALIAGGLRAGPGDGLALSGPGGGVGTLPATKDDGHQGVPVGPYGSFGGASQMVTVTAPSSGAPAAITLRGLDADLDALISVVYSPDGSGWFELSAPDLDGLRTLSYYGNVLMELDRTALQLGRTSVGLAIDPTAQGSLAVLGFGDRRATQVLTAGLTELPLHRAARAGLLRGGLSMKIAGAAAAEFEFATRGRAIQIQQTH